MKKFLALVLALCMTSSLALPAAASDAALEARITAVTLSTKKLLGIGDEYTKFSSYLSEGSVSKQWNLTWQNEKSSIDVRVTEGGKLVSYALNFSDNPYISSTGELKRFPKLSKAQASKLAQDFLAKVLDSSIESCTLREGDNRLAVYDNGNYHFSGKLSINGKSSPVYVSLVVNSAKKMVTSFYRSDDGLDYHAYPAKAGISREGANKSLYDTVKMNLHYVVSEKDDRYAILQYTPEMKADYVVDAMTGALLERRPAILYKEALASAQDNAGGTGLTPVEQKTVQELKGCLSAQALEAAARGIAELGIHSGFKLESNNYFTEKTEQDTTIYAQLSFVQTGLAEGKYASKTVSLNAKTGAFLSVNSYASDDSTLYARYSRGQSEAIARAFAEKYHANELKDTALAAVLGNTEKERYQSFSFVRQVNGIAFPDNQIAVTVDAWDGSIANDSISWDQNMSFADAKKIKTEQEAKAIYEKAAGLSLFYEYIAKENGTAESELKLVYGFENPNVWGVDPVTGKALSYPENETLPFVYGDIAGHYAQKQIETLAEYNIGYPGGAFEPNLKLTQKDALRLLVPACGFTLQEDAEDFEEMLYSNAYSLGLLTSEERNPSAVMTRANLTKMLVDAAGYGEVAKLKDIYRIGYQDEKDIPKDLIGYVAIAKGLGIVRGNANGTFQPNAAATRAQLAIMLYQVLSR